MTLRIYTYSESEEDQQTYDMLKSWAPEMMPPGFLLPKLGVIVYDKETPICFLCADMSNSIPRALMDHLQTNPKAPAMKRFKAVKMAEKFLCQRLKELGFSVINSVTPHSALACLSQRLGYIVNPKPVVHFQKAI